MKLLCTQAICFVLLNALMSCGYNFVNGNGPSRYATVSVPYVIGDQDGSLTAAIIRELVREGTFHYRDCNGALILRVKQIDQEDDNIGFRYDRKKRGDIDQRYDSYRNAYHLNRGNFACRERLGKLLWVLCSCLRASTTISNFYLAEMGSISFLWGS